MKPYPFANKKYNRSCLFCGKAGNGVAIHVTKQQQFERWLRGARAEVGLEVRPDEIKHLI